MQYKGIVTEREVQIVMVEMMNAVGYTEHLPISEENSLFDFKTIKPIPKGRDLLVKIEAVAVNPVDISTRKNKKEKLDKNHPKILGWDALGEVVGCGDEVRLFEKGERVFYAGAIDRPGSNADYQLVDERLVALAPKKLTQQQSVAMPLTSLTAWEALFEKLQISRTKRIENAKKTILIINGAGGVGSIATQLAAWAGLKVIATASREESIRWTLAHGAVDTINHRIDMPTQLKEKGIDGVDYILQLSDIDGHWAEMAKMIKPNGRIASITGNQEPLDLGLLKPKSVNFSWEWMYTKSFYQLPEMISQHEILEKISTMLNDGVIKSTVTEVLHTVNAETLRKAHEMIETNHTIGKIVICN